MRYKEHACFCVLLVYFTEFVIQCSRHFCCLGCGVSEDEKLHIHIQIQISNSFHPRSSHSMSVNAFAGRI